MKWISRISGLFLLFVLTVATDDSSVTACREENTGSLRKLRWPM
ncbi:MAG: hypothetical protein A4E49_02572 [Methanosaeta sp. PtaU1.Bin112]|nr:MAG: hypothetical protein A4E49_02572 [Methanosaeta sp. PtaU1.Bin112]